jgi:hypothetical protein
MGGSWLDASGSSEWSSGSEGETAENVDASSGEGLSVKVSDSLTQTEYDLTHEPVFVYGAWLAFEGDYAHAA